MSTALLVCFSAAAAAAALESDAVLSLPTYGKVGGNGSGSGSGASGFGGSTSTKSSTESSSSPGPAGAMPHRSSPESVREEVA